MLDKILKYLDPAKREGLENLISLTFVLLAFVYVTLFLGDLYPLLKSLVSKDFSAVPYLDYILKYGIVILVPVIYARFFVFAHDSLATGTDRFARFFQLTLPSTFLRDEFGMEQRKANELWFKIFNVWKNKNHPRNPQWYSTFRRTYSCRFVYLLRRWLFRAVILFAVTLGVDSWYKWFMMREALFDGIFLARAIVISVSLLLAIMLSTSNRVGRNPTGCWARLLEIEDGHKAWLEQQVVKPSGK